MLYKLLQIIKKEENVTQIYNSNKDKQKENCRYISLINIDAKFLNISKQKPIPY